MSSKGFGILGGTFDPIHWGHLQMAKSVYERMHLEQIMFVPAYVAPHKVGLDIAPAKDRFIMTELAVEAYKNFTVSDIELCRSGVSYTIDTLKELHRLYPDKKLYFIIGADSVVQLHTWNNIEEMMDLTTFVAAGRPGYDDVMEEVVKHLGEKARKHILFLDTPEYDISSTEIRTRIQQNLSLDGMVPKVVEQYIFEHNLYKK